MHQGTAFALFFTSLVAGTVGLIYYTIHTRHKEKLMLIEKGADAKLFQTEPRKKNYFFTILLGTVFICISLGITFGFFLQNSMYEKGIVNRGNPLPYFVCVFLMIGIGFVSTFFLNKKLNR